MKIISEVTNEDCMDMMKRYPDKFFELAIVDPPYGIHDKILKGGDTGRVKFHKMYEKKQWDQNTPTQEYFDELFRVSKSQIIWGGNYFTDKIPPSRGWIIWDKLCDNVSVVNNEMCWTSFDKGLKMIRRGHGMDKGFLNKEGKNIHPTQKSVFLYEWILKNYAKKGDKILDTHLGSGSSRIAAYKLGFDFYGCEIDKDYFEESNKRFIRETITINHDNKYF